MPILVSLVIPIYNRAPYLPSTIASILSQTYPHFELILWDDGSTDTSLQIAQHHATLDPRIRVVAAPHQGYTPSLSSAFALTRGTYLGWVDSDDLLCPTALAETVHILDTHPNVGMVYTDYEHIDPQGSLLSPGTRTQTPYSPDRLLVEFMTFHFRLMHRSVFEQVGGIDPRSGLVPDYDLCLRLSETTQIHHHPHSRYRYRIHPGSMSQQRQQETITDSQAAVERALHRRGLSKDYQLNVQITQTDTGLKSRFQIEPKQVPQLVQ